MKTSMLYKTFVAVAVASIATGCSENAWNNHLDGFEELNNEPIANLQSIEYTLTDADYAAIASNATNKALAGDEFKNALAAVGTAKAFSADIPAAQYVPAYLSSTSFPYFTLTRGSAVKLTYNVVVDADPAVAAAAAAQLYTVTTDEYQETVWDSEEDYVDAFTPSKPASRFLPQILSYNVDHSEGDYVIVSYSESAQEPVFGNVGGNDEPAPTPEFKLSSVLGSVALDQTVTVNAIVTAICQQGYILTDASASVFSYCGSAFDPQSVAVGDQVTVTGTIGSYNRGFQFVANKPEVPYSLTVVGHQEVSYPAPVTYNGEQLDAVLNREGNEAAVYCRLKATVALSGNYINLNVDGATSARGSVYQATEAQRAAFTDGAEVTVDGYLIAIAGSVNCNIVVTSVNGTAVSRARAHRAPAADVPSVVKNVLYHWTGSAWAPASDFSVLNPADYTAMGQTYQNLTEPALYLPKYLAANFPYAQEGEIRNVVYKLYKNAVTTYACDQYVYTDGNWTLNDNRVVETNQFVYTSTGWMYDPNVTIDLPAGRGQEFSSIYYQACTDWVYENICVPLGDTSIKSGKFYVTSYGNNEYYSGTSAYQNNIDLRPDKAREQYPAGYEGMSDAEIVALEKQRFMNEVMPGALGMIHPDAKPIDGLDVLYTIHFYVYTGSTTDYTAVFRVAGPGKFEPVSCTWDD